MNIPAKAALTPSAWKTYSAGDVLIWAEVLYSNQSRLFIQYGAGDIITVPGA